MSHQLEIVDMDFDMDIDTATEAQHIQTSNEMDLDPPKAPQLDSVCDKLQHLALTQRKASHKVLTSPKLLPKILLNLPMTDLLTRAPLVCRHWNHTISTHIALQQALFLSPLPGIRIQYRDDAWYTISARPTIIESQEITANPFLSRFQGPITVSSSSKQCDAPAVVRPEASWRKMLISQPKITGVVLRVREAGILGGEMLRAIEDDGEGLKLGFERESRFLENLAGIKGGDVEAEIEGAEGWRRV